MGAEVKCVDSIADVSVADVWPQTTVHISVLDVNDNTPEWVYPLYPKNTTTPPTGTLNTFYASVPVTAKPNTPVIQVLVSEWASHTEYSSLSYFKKHHE